VIKVPAKRIAVFVVGAALLLLCVVYPWGLSIGEVKQLASVSNEIREAKSLVLFEGLPHPLFEREVLRRELETKEIFRKGDQPFYAKPLSMSENEIHELRKIVSSSRSYKSYSGIKKCGGFHADYCISWEKEPADYDFLVCFGCEEMEIRGPSSTLKVDLRTSTAQSLMAILSKHRFQRPSGAPDAAIPTAHP
jgi:hypothetical protein